MVGEAERLEVEEGSDRRAPLGGVCVKERETRRGEGEAIWAGESWAGWAVRERKGEGKK